MKNAGLDRNSFPSLCFQNVYALELLSEHGFKRTDKVDGLDQVSF